MIFKSMTESRQQKVHIIDDDEAIRDSMSMLFDAEQIPYCVYTSADEFLAGYDNTLTGCLVLDIRMPGRNGLELQQELIKANSILPVIFMTGHGDLPMAVEAMRRGALDFIRKPIDEQALLARIHEAFVHESGVRKDQQQLDEALQKYKSLTNREQQIFDLVSMGETNKKISHRLEISEKTVEVHRSNLMKKMNAASISQLVRQRLCLEKVDVLTGI